MIRTLALVALFASSTLALAATQGSVYKWKDAAGATHYSDAPPPQGTSFTRVKAGISSAGTAPPDASATASAASTAEKEKADSDAAAAKATQAEANAKLCDQAKANIKLLQGTGPLQIARDGKQEALAEAGRADELNRAKAAATLYCK